MAIRTRDKVVGPDGAVGNVIDDGKFQNLVQALPDAVLVHCSGTIVFVNPATVRLLGATSAQQLLGRQIFDFIHPDFIPAIQERIRRFPTLERPDTPLEHLMVALDGSHRDVEGLAIPISWEGAPAIEVVIRDISERRRAQHSTLEWNTRLELAQRSGLKIGLWQWDLASQMVEWSDETYRQFGVTREGFSGRVEDATERIHPADLQRVSEAIEKSITNSTDYAGQYRTVWPDGTICWIDARGSIVRNGSTRMVGISIDITEFKKTEAVLLETQQNQMLLLNSTAEGIYGLDLDGCCTFCNPAAARMLGYESPDGLLNKSVHSAHHNCRPDGTPYAKEDCLIYEGFRKGTGTHSAEEYFYRVDGSRFPVEYWSYPTRRDGEVVGCVVTFLDITERRSAEGALIASQESYREFIENASFGIYRSKPDGTLLDVNPALVSMLGYDSKQELLNCNLNTSIYQMATDRADAMAKHGSASRISGFVTTWKRKDASIISVRLAGTEIKKDDQVSHYEIIAEDITEHRLLEEQLRQSQKMEAVGRLAGGVAHDFNNALGVITGYSELLQLKLNHDETLHRQAGEIFKAGQKAASLTRQLLAFSRKQTLRPQVVSLNTVVRDVEKMLRRLIGENIDLVHVLASDLELVMADPGQMEQVLMNLAVNARDAMPRGGKLRIQTENAELGEELALRYKYVKPGKYAMLSVTDTGCGMDEKTQSQIFEPFFTTKEVGKGTGLGLSTVYGIVKQSGGYIWVDSTPGEGARFRLYLPVTSNVAEGTPAAQKAAPIPFGSETVLLVEDEAALRDLACSALQSGGYTVLEAGSAESAMAVAKQHDGRIHLLLSDVILPGLSGRDLAETLAKSYPDLRIIFMSGYTDDLLGSHGVLGPDITLLEKPFSNKALLRKIREVLDA